MPWKAVRFQWRPVSTLCLQAIPISAAGEHPLACSIKPGKGSQQISSATFGIRIGSKAWLGRAGGAAAPLPCFFRGALCIIWWRFLWAAVRRWWKAGRWRQLWTRVRPYTIDRSALVSVGVYYLSVHSLTLHS